MILKYLKRFFTLIIFSFLITTLSGCYLFSNINKNTENDIWNDDTFPTEIPINKKDEITSDFNISSIYKRKSDDNITINITFTSKYNYDFVWFFFQFYTKDKSKYFTKRTYKENIKQNKTITYELNFKTDPYLIISDDLDYAIFGNSKKLEDSRNYVILINKTQTPKLIEIKNNEIPFLPLETDSHLLFEGFYLNNNYQNKITDNLSLTKDTFIFVKLVPNILVINNIQNELIKSNVSIITTFRDFFNISQSQGSGVVVQEEENGYFILTNHHVISDGSKYGYTKQVDIKNYKQEKIRGYVLFSRPDYDLALIWVYKSNSELKAIKLADKNPKIGDFIIAIGQPDNQSNTITVGDVKKYDTPVIKDSKIFPEFKSICHSAPIHFGSSGGALLNDKLELCGINFAGSENKDAPRNYAIPIGQVYNFYALYNNSQ